MLLHEMCMRAMMVSNLRPVRATQNAEDEQPKRDNTHQQRAEIKKNKKKTKTPE